VLGNCLGSFSFNALVIIGLCALITPLPVPGFLDITVMGVASFLLRRSERKRTDKQEEYCSLLLRRVRRTRCRQSTGKSLCKGLLHHFFLKAMAVAQKPRRQTRAQIGTGVGAG
jgi:hypothetical protein